MRACFFEWLFDLGYRLRGKKRSRRLTLGNSVIGSLRKFMLDRKIPLWLNCGMKDLIVEDGRVVGVLAERNGQPFRIRVKKGVILGAGGFEKISKCVNNICPILHTLLGPLVRRATRVMRTAQAWQWVRM